jgi:hypothetical protein
MSRADDMDRDEVTGRTSRIAMLEIRTQAGEKANQEVIGVQSTLHKLKWLVAAALTVGAFVNLGVWLNDKAHHFATKQQVNDHDARLDRIEKREDVRDAHIRSQTEAIKRMADNFDDLNKFMRGRRRGQ